MTWLEMYGNGLKVLKFLKLCRLFQVVFKIIKEKYSLSGSDDVEYDIYYPVVVIDQLF